MVNDVVAELTPAQIEELAGDLETLHAQLEDQLERIGEHSKPVELDQQLVGRLSRMDALQQQEMARASQAHMSAHLARVTAALRAVASGDYSFCRSCDNSIAFARLKASPDSSLCIGCQERDER